MTQIPILTVMEFVPGTDFTEIDPAEVLTTVNCSEEELHKRLHDIGKVIMYDVLLNNWDRLPILWASEGNLGNLFYSNNPDQRIVAIDNTITSIPVDSDPFKEYMGKVTQLLDDIATWNESVEGTNSLVEKLRTYLRNSMNVDIGKKGTYAVWQGMISGVITIHRNVTTEKLETLRDEMAQEVAKVFEAMVHGQDFQSQYGLTRVNLAFLEAMLSVYTKYVPTFLPLQQ